jgi:hypothetical protein
LDPFLDSNTTINFRPPLPATILQLTTFQLPPTVLLSLKSPQTTIQTIPLQSPPPNALCLTLNPTTVPFSINPQLQNCQQPLCLSINPSITYLKANQP